MGLTAGSTIGQYEILAPLGAGGMGEVHRARHRLLEREVAVKVLPDDVAAKPERLLRFEREATLLASLKHDHVARVLEFHRPGDDGAPAFLVMELVAGETLAEKLRTGPLPVSAAFELATQAAAGLEAAHRAGVIHRDLKPANLIVVPEGYGSAGHLEIVDFGLAKAVPGGGSDRVARARRIRPP